MATFAADEATIREVALGAQRRLRAAGISLD